MDRKKINLETGVDSRPLISAQALQFGIIMKSIKFISIGLMMGLLFSVSYAQKPKFNYPAQKKFIPVELGQVYLGMPFKAFAAKIPLKDVEADTRFEPLELIIPYKKGNITALTIRIHGLSAEEKAAIVKPGKIKDKDLRGDEYERDAELLDVTKIPAKGFVYAMYISFKDDFDLKTWSTKTFGKPADIYKKGDNGYFYDYQWTVKSTDGLVWLIRCYFNEGKSLQLLGRIKDTEWDPMS
jgi:hypothetical protein